MRRTPKLLVYFSKLEGKAAILVLGKPEFSEFEAEQALPAWGWEVAFLCSHMEGIICLLAKPVLYFPPLVDHSLLWDAQQC